MAEDNTPNESFLNPSRRSYVYESAKGSGNKKRIVFIIIGIIILIGLVVFAVISTGGKGEEDKLSPTPTQISNTPTPAPSDTPTPGSGTPTPTSKLSPTPAKGTPTPKVTSSSVDKTSGLDRADLKLSVLNGSGTPGAASKMSDYLKNLGYDIVSSGNADNFDYTNTTVQVTSAKKAFLSLLKNDLSTDFTVDSATADYTGTSSDGVVIVGKQ